MQFYELDMRKGIFFCDEIGPLEGRDLLKYELAHYKQNKFVTNQGEIKVGTECVSAPHNLKIKKNIFNEK